MNRIITHKSWIPVSADRVTAFHDTPQTLSLLTMPPLILQILRDDRSSLTEGEVAFRLWLGPVPVRWVARHEPGPIPTSFRDVQVVGPHRSWVHDHVFEPGTGGTHLIDRIAIGHEPGIKGLLTRIFFDGPLLRLLFVYRHWQTRRILTRESERSSDAYGCT